MQREKITSMCFIVNGVCLPLPKESVWFSVVQILECVQNTILCSSAMFTIVSAKCVDTCCKVSYALHSMHSMQCAVHFCAEVHTAQCALEVHTAQCAVQ